VKDKTDETEENKHVIGQNLAEAEALSSELQELEARLKVCSTWCACVRWLVSNQGAHALCFSYYYVVAISFHNTWIQLDSPSLFGRQSDMIALLSRVWVEQNWLGLAEKKEKKQTNKKKKEKK